MKDYPAAIIRWLEAEADLIADKARALRAPGGTRQHRQHKSEPARQRMDILERCYRTVIQDLKRRAPRPRKENP